MHIGKKTPEHQAVYETLREMIMLGRFSPGQPVTVKGLTEQLGVGVTPVREAVRRLISESALETLGNRRVIVTSLTQEQLEDIYFIRLQVEPELARKAAKNLTKEHFDTLSTLDKDVNVAIEAGDVNAYLEKNRAFHFGIYALANSPVLMSVAQSLWMQVGPSLRVVCGRYGTANLPDKHPDILQALLDGNADAAASSMREDLEQGIILVGQPLSKTFDQNNGVLK